MARFRVRKQTVWKAHSLLGIVAGLGLLVIGLTGSALMFSREIDGFLRPGVVRVEPGPARLPMDELIARVTTAFPSLQLTGWALFPRDPSASDRAWLKVPDQEAWLYAQVDPYGGKILSRPAESGDHFTGWLLELHHSLLADHAGMLAAGIFAVILVLSGLTGAWLHRNFLRNLLRLRWGASARILFSDLHKFVGIASLAFNLVLGFTGAWWNLSHLLGHLAGNAPPAAASGAPAAERASIDAMMTKAKSLIAGFTTHYLSFPETGDGLVSLHGQHGGASPFRGLYGSQIDFDAGSGAVREVRDLRDDSAWAQIRDSFMPLHYGSFGGWPVRILWCLGGLAPGTLAVTGFVIWRNRRRARPSFRRERAPASSPGPPSPRAPSRRDRPDEAART